MTEQTDPILSHLEEELQKAIASAASVHTQEVAQEANVKSNDDQTDSRNAAQIAFLTGLRDQRKTELNLS